MKNCSCLDIKKIIFLIFILFFCLPTIAQVVPIGEYTVKVEGYGHHSTNATCSTRVEVSVTLDNSDVLKVVQLPSYPNNQQFDINGELNFSAEHSIVSFYFYAQRSWSNVWGCRDPQRGSYTKSISFPYNCQIYNSIEKNNNTAGDGLWTDNINVTVVPNLTILNPDPLNNFIATDHNTVITSYLGFAPNEYKWQYKTNNMVAFESLPQFDGQSSINVNAQDILGSDVDNYIGEFIEIRQMSGCGNFSNVVSYRILKSAPKIINHGPAVRTTCFDANDGQYRLYFDRPLDSDANENINIELRNIVQQTPTNYTGIYQLDADNSFNMTDIPAGTYELRINGKYNNVDMYSETVTNPIIFTVEKNTPVDFSVTKTDVWCYQGTDGQIHITASGGTETGYEYQINGGAWIPFADPSSFTETVNGLSEGVYSVKVRDANGCVAKIQGLDADGKISLGAEKEVALTLVAPQEPLSIEYTLVQQPIYHGATNGKLVAKVVGGTLFDDNSYWFEWKNEQGQVQTTTTQFSSGEFYITLNAIPAGMYYLTVRDKNYTNATDNNNCTIIGSEIELTEPEPLTAVIQLVQPISCHLDNEFGDQTDMNPADGQRDETQDGILKIVVTGGKQFTGNQNGGLPYKYTWKQQNTNGIWEILPHTEDTLPQLSDGNYAVNVEDANGIIIGIYQNNALVEATDITYYLQQPDKLELDFDSEPATCVGGDGYAKALVSGGTAPYSYEWSNGADTEEISSLSAMTYFVTITDARGCQVQGSVIVEQPEDVIITESIVPLLCHDASDASIEVQVNGGTLPYTYLWNNGATESRISNIAAGTYSVTITDAQGCSYVQSYTIENPDEITIDLGEDRTLCDGQTLELDATIAEEPGTQYIWSADNGFSSQDSLVVLSESGTYTVTATTPNGCVVTDSITISRADFKIDAEFLLTTQAFVDEEVVLVNVSNPKGKTTEWFIPEEDVTIVEENSDYITLKFSNTGSHLISLMQTQGDCFQLFDKEIIVEQNNGQYNPVNANANFIKEFTVAPNPNNGNFDVIVRLEEDSPVKLRLFNSAGQVAHPEKSLPSAKVHSVNYSINVNAGTYILVLETPYQVLTKKLIIY